MAFPLLIRASRKPGRVTPWQRALRRGGGAGRRRLGLGPTGAAG